MRTGGYLPGGNRRPFTRGPVGVRCFLLLLLAAGCAGEPMESSVPVPPADAGFHRVWAYAASLEKQVKIYAARRWGEFPDGLRRAVTRHRLAYFASGEVQGSVADLQSYLFFEYRRRVSLDGDPRPGEPDAETARYVRALLRAIRERE